MESVFVLIPISIVLVFIIGGFLWWSSKSGQFDDLEGPGYRVLMDDDSTDHLNDDAEKDVEKDTSAADSVPEKTTDKPV